ncbi:unnamed protein product [Effrenium voratum]|nr:unnamed protein product [Effrenium voratum]
MPSSSCISFAGVCAPGRRKSKLQKYGGALAWTVHEEGGPFVLADDDDLTTRALRKLGYANARNEDLEEFMFIFANTAGNKTTQRKMSLLPCPDDQASDVAKKLRAAFIYLMRLKGNGRSHPQTAPLCGSFFDKKVVYTCKALSRVRN